MILPTNATDFSFLLTIFLHDLIWTTAFYTTLIYLGFQLTICIVPKVWFVPFKYQINVFKRDCITSQSSFIHSFFLAEIVLIDCFESRIMLLIYLSDISGPINFYQNQFKFTPRITVLLKLSNFFCLCASIIQSISLWAISEYNWMGHLPRHTHPNWQAETFTGIF